MKRKILVALALIALLSIFTTLALHAQDVVILKHKAYTTYYSKSKHYPVKVEWWITKASLSCTDKVKRGDKFIPDPLLPAETNLQADYTGAGFDRGHNMSTADASCNQVANKESFYFSNITAQYPALNRGDWKSLEMLSRKIALKYDSVHIWAGSVGIAKYIGTTAIPTKCWKVIYIKKSKEWMAFVFNNTTDKVDGINNNKVAVADVEKLTRLKFKAKH